MTYSEDRAKCLKMHYWSLFQHDIRNLNFYNIQKLYDAAGITTDMLVKQLDRHVGRMTGLQETIFNDITFILVEKLIDNPRLEELFDQLYYPQYKAIYDDLRKAEKTSETNVERAEMLLSEVARRVLKTASRKNVEDVREQDRRTVTYSGVYLIMCILTDRFDGLYNIMGEGPRVYESARNWDEREKGTKELDLSSNVFCFTYEDEPVIGSRMYQKYLRIQKEKLADYLKIPAEKVADHFYKQLEFDVRSEDLTFLPNNGEAGISNMAMIHVVQENYGGTEWIQTITTSPRIRPNSLGYKPDFDKILSSYYRARVEVKFIECDQNQRPFTKGTLMQECQATPQEDYIALLYLYNIDIVYQMFDLMQHQYYRNFSWDNITKQSALSRSNSIIATLQDQNNAKDEKIAKLSRTVEDLRMELGKASDVSNVIELRSHNDLLEIIDKKNSVIEELKNRLRFQDELLDAFNQEEDDETESSDIDMDLLHQKRFLFVGHTEEDFPELNHALKKEFPNSIFMRTETDTIDKIQVDAIVIFLKWTSHGMYYKVKATNSLSDIPLIFCKTKNIDRILREMTSGLNA